MEPTSKIILSVEDDNRQLKIGYRVEAEIRERISLLEKRVVAHRKHGMRTGRDETELAKLREFLQSLGLTLAVCLAVSCMPSLARAGSPLIEGRAPCGPYMSARTCLDAVREETEECITFKFKGAASPAQQVECINASLSKAGAFDTGGEEGGEP